MNRVDIHQSVRPSTFAPWSNQLPPAHLSGSLYAVPTAHRPAAARSVHGAGHGIHLDVIIDSDGRQLGITTEEVRAVRRDLPEAAIDLHLILLGEHERSERARLTSRGIDLAREVRAECLTLPRAALVLDRAVLSAAHDADLALWQQLSPGEPVDLLEPATGALVMLIAPGTTDQADPSRLGLVSALAKLGHPVGVDGGVNQALALQAHELGATRIVSGRALLRAGPPRDEHLPARP